MVGFVARRPHLWLLLIYPLVGAGFAYCEWAVPALGAGVTTVEWPLVDRAIPFVPWFVWPYFLWYGLIAFTFVWTGWNTDGREFLRFSAFIYLGMTFSYVVYLFWPNGQDLRPPLSSLGTGPEADALRWLYTHDTPTNCCPSIHVIDMMAVWFALARDRFWGHRPWFRGVLAAASIAVIASTVLIKQHSVLDLVAGGALSLALYALIYRFRSN